MIRRALTACVAAVVVMTTMAFVPSASGQPVPAAPPAGCAAAFPGYDPPPVAAGGTTTTVRIPMSDGVALRADVTLPAGIPGPFPTTLTVTGYNKQALGAAGAVPLVNYGYASVLVDDRGTGASPGGWDAWGPRTVADYTDILDWITAQPWSDGKVGVTGTSYMAISSLRVAATQHPAVKAVFAIVPMADAYRDIVFGGGGMPNTVFIPGWMGLVSALALPSTDDPKTLVDHAVGLVQFQIPTLVEAAAGGLVAYDGPFWQQRSPISVVDKITAPTFIVGGLDDIFQRGEPLLYEHLADHTDARLLIGPWTHLSATQGLPADGVPTVNQLLLQWFDQHVRGIEAGASCIPQVTQYIRGLGRYESAPSWPVPGLRAERWFLRGGGGLTPQAPAAAEAGQAYLSAIPTGLCSRSSAQWLVGGLGEPCATDNRLGELGALTYTSEPFAAPQVINGPIQADVWITTDRSDATVSVAVSMVGPDGASRGLTNGLLLASHRAVDPARARLLDGQSIQPWHPFTQDAQQEVTPGVPTLLPIEVFPTSAVVPAGYRLRITVAPFDLIRGLPTVAAALDSLGGLVTILNDAAHPSSVVFPVVGATQASVAARLSDSAAAAALFQGASKAKATILIW